VSTTAETDKNGFGRPLLLTLSNPRGDPDPNRPAYGSEEGGYDSGAFCPGVGGSLQDIYIDSSTDNTTVAVDHYWLPVATSSIDLRTPADGHRDIHRQTKRNTNAGKTHFQATPDNP